MKRSERDLNLREQAAKLARLEGDIAVVSAGSLLGSYDGGAITSNVDVALFDLAEAMDKA